jgi:Rieske Fe-S protein
VGDALFWDTASPYHYVRQQRVGREDLLIVGGEDHKVGHETDTMSRYEKLLEWARERFAVRSVEYRWSAQTVEPADGLPYIGRTPQSDRVLVATGFSGNGITFGTVAAILMRDMVLGRKNEWAEVYSAGRIKPLAAAKDFVEENADVAARFVLDRLRTPAGSSVEPAPGEGCVVEVDGHKLAVFRPERGQATAVSAVCTHLGCLVSWNAGEQSWDCPCHGSRFATDGSVIDAPATRALERHETDSVERRGAAVAGGGKDGIRRA